MMCNFVQSRRLFLGSTCAVLLGFSAIAAKADTVVYNNLDISSDLGYGYNPGGAGVVGDTDYTPLLADDITPAAGTAGVAVNSISFSVVNYDSIDLTFSPILEVFSDNGGVPGTLLYQSEPGMVTVKADEEGIATVSSPGTMFTTPASTFFVGVIFSDATTDPIAPVALDELGLGIYDPPSAGSSEDEFFQANHPASPGGSNPSGGFYNFGGNPPGNFGFELSGIAVPAVPEPSSFSLLALGAASIGGLVRRARRKA